MSDEAFIFSKYIAPTEFVIADQPTIKSRLIIVPDGGFELLLTKPVPSWFRRWTLRLVLGWKWERVEP